MALAKSVNAKVTVLTVSTPFHVFAIVLGSEAVKVLPHSTIPVLVFRTPHPPFFIAS